MTGKEYADLVARYLLHAFGSRGIRIYREVPVGKSVIGKNRRVDLLIVHPETNAAMAVECKYQDSAGTVDEKIPYALDDMRALRMPGCIVYAGRGFSEGVLHLLQGSELAARCSPNPSDLGDGRETWELDHLLACHFRWWDVLVRDKEPFVPADEDPADPWGQAGSLFVNLPRK